ncbi:MAG: hypothetical protein ACOX8E_03695 [Ruminococcus sp.]|jgi:hypothetical protein
MANRKGMICLMILILALVSGVLWYLWAQNRTEQEHGGTLVKYEAVKDAMV